MKFKKLPLFLTLLVSGMIAIGSSIQNPNDRNNRKQAGPPKVTKVVVKSECAIVCAYSFEVEFDQELPTSSMVTFTDVAPREDTLNCDSNSLYGGSPTMEIPELTELSGGDKVLSGDTSTDENDPPDEYCSYLVTFILSMPEDTIRFEDEVMEVEHIDP